MKTRSKHTVETLTLTERDESVLRDLAWLVTAFPEHLHAQHGRAANLRTFIDRLNVLVNRRLLGKGVFARRPYYFLRQAGVAFLHGLGVNCAPPKLTPVTTNKHLARSTFALDTSDRRPFRRLHRQNELSDHWLTTKAPDRVYFREDDCMLSLFLGVQTAPLTLLHRIKRDAQNRTLLHEPTGDAVTNAFVENLALGRFRWAVACASVEFADQLLAEAKQRKLPIEQLPPEQILRIEVLPSLRLFCLPEVKLPPVAKKKKKKEKEADRV